MLSVLWTKYWGDGTPANDSDLVSVLAKAPEKVLQTVLFGTLIDSFYQEQKANLVIYGFIPYVCYFAAAILYLTSTRVRIKS